MTTQCVVVDNVVNVVNVVNVAVVAAAIVAVAVDVDFQFKNAKCSKMGVSCKVKTATAYVR